jgi:hypothetical protein
MKILQNGFTEKFTSILSKMCTFPTKRSNIFLNTFSCVIVLYCSKSSIYNNSSPDQSLSLLRLSDWVPPCLQVVIVQVTLGRVLQALLTLKGMMIEWVNVKGFGETLELWTESRHKVSYTDRKTLLTIIDE